MVEENYLQVSLEREQMSAPRKYANNAERQAAYRARYASQVKIESGLRSLVAPPRIPPAMGHRRWNTMMVQACSMVETAIGEMEAYYEEKSEAWQDSERGERLSEKLESAQEIAALMRDLH